MGDNNDFIKHFGTFMREATDFRDIYEWKKSRKYGNYRIFIKPYHASFKQLTWRDTRFVASPIFEVSTEETADQIVRRLNAGTRIYRVEVAGSDLPNPANVWTALHFKFATEWDAKNFLDVLAEYPEKIVTGGFSYDCSRVVEDSEKANEPVLKTDHVYQDFPNDVEPLKPRSRYVYREAEEKELKVFVGQIAFNDFWGEPSRETIKVLAASDVDARPEIEEYVRDRGLLFPFSIQRLEVVRDKR